MSRLEYNLFPPLCDELSCPNNQVQNPPRWHMPPKLHSHKGWSIEEHIKCWLQSCRGTRVSSDCENRYLLQRWSTQYCKQSSFFGNHVSILGPRAFLQKTMTCFSAVFLDFQFCLGPKWCVYRLSDPSSVLEPLKRLLDSLEPCMSTWVRKIQTELFRNKWIQVPPSQSRFQLLTFNFEEIFRCLSHLF